VAYWFLPNDQGQSKLRVFHDGHHWLAKQRHEWWDEIRLSPRQIDRALKVLVDQKGLLFKAIYPFAGKRCLHLRINGSVFGPAWVKTMNTPATNPYLPKGSNHQTVISPKKESDSGLAKSPNRDLEITDSLFPNHGSVNPLHRVPSESTGIHEGAVPQPIPWDVELVKGDFPAEDLKPGDQVLFRETSSSTSLLPGFVLKINPRTIALVNALTGEKRDRKRSVSAGQVFVVNGQGLLRMDPTKKEPEFKLGPEGVSYQLKKLNGQGGLIDYLLKQDATPEILDELNEWYEGNYWTGVKGQPLSLKIIQEGAGGGGPAWGQFIAQREEWVAEGKPAKQKKDRQDNTERWERENRKHQAKVPTSLTAWSQKGVSSSPQ
jgi:hypothetical protein